MVYAVCVWLLRLGDQTSFTIAVVIGAIALVIGLAQWAWGSIRSVKA